MSDNGSDDDSTSAAGPEVPRGVLQQQRKSRWQGEELEWEHQRETKNGRPEEQRKTSSIVDVSQFRNDEVGKGYQARHVIRQRSAHNEEVTIRDMTRTTSTTTTTAATAKAVAKMSPLGKKRKHRKGSKHDEDDGHTATRKDAKARLLKYLQCEGMRRFRKELDKIEDVS